MSSSSYLSWFLDISCELTGFSEAELQATGMTETYLNAVQQNNAADDVHYFFEKAKEILSAPGRTAESTAAAIAAQLMPVSSYNNLAQNIIQLWYTGNWGADVLNADAYIQGLMWEAGHTHPPGAKQPGYGSWAFLPLSVQSQKEK